MYLRLLSLAGIVAVAAAARRRPVSPPRILGERRRGPPCRIRRGAAPPFRIRRRGGRPCRSGRTWARGCTPSSVRRSLRACLPSEPVITT